MSQGPQKAPCKLGHAMTALTGAVPSCYLSISLSPMDHLPFLYISSQHWIEDLYVVECKVLSPRLEDQGCQEGRPFCGALTDTCNHSNKSGLQTDTPCPLESEEIFPFIDFTSYVDQMPMLSWTVLDVISFLKSWCVPHYTFQGLFASFFHFLLMSPY